MPHQEASVSFGREQAADYDKRFAKLAPMREVLHLLIGAVFSDLPIDARVLCVGAGTGSELIYLAQLRMAFGESRCLRRFSAENLFAFFAPCGVAPAAPSATKIQLVTD